MIAIDTNLLVYAHREDSPHHHQSLEILRRLAEGAAPWAIPWPCLHEFLAGITHPRIYRPPTALPTALAAVDALTTAPSIQLLAEGRDHFGQLRDLVQSAQATGPRVHDARIAAICLSHGVRELWSADRDFSWFPRLRVVNPLTSQR